MAGSHPPYGFQYNDARENYVVDPEKMTAIERIFRMVGAEGHTMNATRLAFNCEGVRPPFGARFWPPKYIREAIKDDVYRSHTYEEVAVLVSEEMAPRLDPEKKRYGVWWFNRRPYVTNQVSVSGPEGRNYRRTTKVFDKPRSGWIAVPVPGREYRARTWTPRARPSRITGARAKAGIATGNFPAASSTAASAVVE